MSRQPVISPADWRGVAISVRTDWVHRMSREECDEVVSAWRAARDAGIGIDRVDRGNFPLPRLAPVLARASEVLERGTGMFLVRGFPVERLGEQGTRFAYFGLGRHLGTAICQSPKGDLLGDVRDLGIDNVRAGRGYQSRSGQAFHTDSCDVVGLMVLRPAKSGGESRIASAVAVHNEMLRTRPDLLELLYQRFECYYPDWGERCWRQACFSVYEGHFSCRAIAHWVRLAQKRFPELPRLTGAQAEAFETFQSLPERPGFHFAMMFEPGDIQLLNNHVLLHGRTLFEDHEEPHRKRHLLRLWLSMPDCRPLSPDMTEFYGGEGRAGALRDGFKPRSGAFVYESLVE